MLDRVGRLQLPRAYVEALGLERRVRLALEDDHIAVWPDRPRSEAGARTRPRRRPGRRLPDRRPRATVVPSTILRDAAPAAPVAETARPDGRDASA